MYLRVIELERQLPLGLLLKPTSQQADELGLEDALQQAVVLLLVQDHEIILHRAEKHSLPQLGAKKTYTWRGR